MKNKTAIADFANNESGASRLHMTRITQSPQTNSKFKTQNSKLAKAFTLIELLVVISVIAIIAAMLMPAFNFVERRSIIQQAQSERDQIVTALDRYYSKYGFYPPGNAATTNSFLNPALTNQLYYELIGTTNIGTATSPDFLTLDNRLTNTPVSTLALFGVNGFMNCSRANASQEDSLPAQSFLPALKASQLAIGTLNGNVAGLLCSAANGDSTYQPLPGVTTLTGRNANPWRYVYPGINNPKTYDLWLQLIVGGKTNLICNWKDTPQINAPLP
jgi:prepilin-type N-terminal cleavage/methylation domain-containing protein